MFKFMKTVTVIVAALWLTASEAAVKRFFQDARLPTQQMVERQFLAAVLASNATRILSANAGNTSAAAAVVTSFSAQPDVARNLELTPGGTTASIGNCPVLVTGTDIKGQALTETFHVTSGSTAKVIGVKAFKTVSQVDFPALCEVGAFGATYSLGIGEKIGLNKCLANAANIVFATAGTSIEATRPTIASDATVVASNTADYNGTMNGSNDFQLFFFQNYRCN